MLISCKWLERHVDLSGVDLHELGDRFTLAVAELEGVHEVGRGLDQLVAGRVLEVHAIEGAKIRRTVVDVGGDKRQIVCGAPNVAEGQLVPVALPGAKVGDLEIREAEIRGVASSGMICSAKELGIGEDHAGILVLTDDLAPGTRLADVYPIVDTLFEIDNKSLTHRPDCWGHRGIAREIAALLDRPLKPMDLDVPFTDDRPLTIRVEDEVGCPRYSAVTMSGVTVAPSPLWLRILLHRVGTRPISNVVDATNFVMLDLGNPLHAFDRREIDGDTIVVRRAREGETFTTLDGVERGLNPSDLLIADADRGVALAGIMGGENSEIRDDTSDIVLESANFDAVTVRLTSQRLGLRTESSARFEKSLDPRLAGDASRAFAVLLRELDPDVEVTSAFMDVAAPFEPEPVLKLRVAYVNSRLGTDLSAERIAGILKGLQFGVTDAGDGVLEVTVPSFRATKDVTLEIDLVEEVGRVHGYDNIPPASPSVALGRPHKNERKRFERAVRTYLTTGAGYDEVMTYSFDFDPLLDTLGVTPEARVRVHNPISQEMPALRTSLAPHLLGVAERNDRQTDALGVFEVGRVFLPTSDDSELPDQPVTLGALVARDVPEGGDPKASLFFELKGVIEGVAHAVERPALRLAQGGVDRPWAHPVRQARVLVAGQPIGYVAEVHPETLMRLDLRKGAALLEVDLDAWRATDKQGVGYAPLPRFPAVYRDFAVVVPEQARSGDVRAAIFAASERITAVDFQSVYRGRGVDEGHKSMAWSVTMRRDDQTLAEPEVRDIEQAIWKHLADRVGGVPRA